jgi:hypothetical protein
MNLSCIFLSSIVFSMHFWRLYNFFWNNKHKLKVRKLMYSTGPSFQPEAHHCWTDPAAQWPAGPCQPVRQALTQRGHRAVATRAVVRPARARRRLPRSAVSGVSTRMMRGSHRARRMVMRLTKGVGHRWGGGVLQHGGVEGGEGGQLNEGRGA